MIARREWWFVATLTVAVLVLTSLPYVYGWWTAPADRHFLGLVLNVPDHAQYFAWYRSFQSQWLISNPLTSEPSLPRFFNLQWLLLARFGAASGWSYAWVFQLLRWFAGALSGVATYMLLARVFDDVARRRAAFLVLMLGGGLGWLLVVAKYSIAHGTLWYPLDLYISEGNTFLCLMGYPHFALAAAMIVLVFTLLLDGEASGRLRPAVVAGLVAHLLGWMHAYDMLIVWGIPAAYIGVRCLSERRLPRYWVAATTVMVALSWPPLLYAALLTWLDPTWREILSQFPLLGVYSPNPLHMLVLMGLPLIAAMATAVAQLRRPTPLLAQQRFIVTWFVAGWGLTYLPSDFQVHMISSWQVPIAILATAGIFQLAGGGRSQRAGRWLTVALVAAVIPVNLYLYLWRFYDLGRHDYPYYLHRDDMAAMRWLEGTSADQVVLSALETGRFVPLLSGQRPYLAHVVETLQYRRKATEVQRFFGAADDQERRALLSSAGIRYVFYGPAERALGDFDPGRAAFLRPAFEAPETQVYEVDLAPAGAAR